MLNLLCTNNPFWCLEIPSALLFIKNQKTDGRYQVQKVFIEGDHWKTKIHKRYPKQTAKQKNKTSNTRFNLYQSYYLSKHNDVQVSPVQSRQLWHFVNQDHRQYKSHKHRQHLQFIYSIQHDRHAWLSWLGFFFFCRGSIRGCKHTWCIQPSVMVVDSIAIAWLVSYLKALMALLEVINTVADHSRVT